MTKTDQLLEAILKELRGLRADLRRRSGEPEPPTDETIGPFLNDAGMVYRAQPAPPAEEESEA